MATYPPRNHARAARIMVMGPLALIALAVFRFGPPQANASPAGKDLEAARFTPCAGAARANCVIDGDTIRYRGETIRIADINTPELSEPQCAHEARLARRAALRLTALLNAGPFSLEPIDRDTDRYGRSLRIVTRHGASLGDTLVSEGLAEAWRGYRRDWC